MQCPKCKAEVSGKFCRQCGTPMAVAQNAAPTATAPAGVCPSCGSSVLPGAKFCGKCAEPLAVAGARAAAPAGEKKCVSCGAELQPGAKFCKACGKPTAAAVARPEAAPTAIEAAAPPAAPERSPISAFAPPASSPRPWEAPPITATPQFEREARPKIETTPTYVPPPVSEPLPESYASAAPPRPDISTRPETFSATPPARVRPVPRPAPELETRRTPPPEIPYAGSPGPSNRTAILLTSVAVLGLVFGGITYWYLLRKHAMSSTPNNTTVSQPATSAANKPSAAPSATPASDTPAPAQPATATSDTPAATAPSTAAQAPAAETHKAAGGSSGASPAASAPAKPAETAASPPSADLSGFWEGDYTNTKQVSKVTLQISKNSTDLFTGTMVFDSEGDNSAKCAISGVYNPQSKFLMLKVADCQGQPPAYLQGKIGFSSVEMSAKQMFGVDSAHNSFLNITRQ